MLIYSTHAVRDEPGWYWLTGRCRGLTSCNSKDSCSGSRCVPNVAGAWQAGDRPTQRWPYNAHWKWCSMMLHDHAFCQGLGQQVSVEISKLLKQKCALQPGSSSLHLPQPAHVKATAVQGAAQLDGTENSRQVDLLEGRHPDCSAYLRFCRSKVE